jgi:hypothetical protein
MKRVLTVLAMIMVLTAGKVYAVDPVTTDLWDVAQGAVVTGGSAAIGGSSASNIFGASLGGIENYGDVTTPGIFADGMGGESVHWVKWMTASPVTVDSFNLFAAHDSAGLNRSFSYFELYYKDSANKWQNMFKSNVDVPYTFIDDKMSLLFSEKVTSVTAQTFRANFWQTEGTLSDLGPRVIELDGFSKVVPEPISSALFILGGGVLAGLKRYRGKKRA